MAVSAVVSNNWRTILARVYSQDVTQVQKNIVRFKIGEGGYSGGVPITPDATFTDLQGEGAPQTGLAGFVNGSPVVTGVGTSFDTEFAVGDWIKPGARTTGAPTVNPYAPGYPGTEYDEWGQIIAPITATSITLSANYAGVTTPENRIPMKATAAQGPLFVFRKVLTGVDVLFNSALPAITEITCTVGASEANADQLSNTPEFYELGLFDEDGVMVGYMTFDKQEKIIGVQLVTIADLTF